MKTTKIWTTLSILAVVSACNSDRIETDYCPDDPNKTAPGICGCGVSDFDDAGKLNYSCIESAYSPIDLCPDDPSKTAPGICGCGKPDTDENGIVIAECLEQYGHLDLCPLDPNKTEPGKCGCGVADNDTDTDGTVDCLDGCPEDSAKTEGGKCGCGESDADTDADGVEDCLDECPEDAAKTEPGKCGCGVADFDADGNEVEYCTDGCPDDPDKSAPGVCGCGIPDADSDNDGVLDCNDKCSLDPNKSEAGICGCGTPDDDANMADLDGDTVIDCLDACPQNPNKSAEGTTDCDLLDSDGDGVNDEDEDCPFNPTITTKAAEGEEPAECNYNKDHIFEIWSANDFKRLQNIVNEIIDEEDAIFNYKFTCEGSYNYDSYHNVYELKEIECLSDTELLACQHDDKNNLYFYNIIDVFDCIDESDVSFISTWNQAEYDEGIATREFQACNTSHFFPTCASDGKHSFKCTYNSAYEYGDFQRAELNECPGGCTQHTNSNGNSYVSCNNCSGTSVDTLGSIGQCCNTNKYVETCSRSGNALRCINGRVTEMACSECNAIEGQKSVNCAVDKKLSLPLIHARLMKDIDLSEAYKVTKVIGNAYIKPTPIDLYRVELDGQNHRIIATSDYGKTRLQVTSPIFSNIVNAHVHDLELDFDMGGLAASSLANWVYRSKVDNISWHGQANLSTSILGEHAQSFGGLINSAEHSTLSGLHASGSIQSVAAMPVAGLINYTSDSMLSNSDVDFEELKSKSTSAGAVYKSSSNSIFNNIQIHIDNYSNATAAGFIYSSDSRIFLDTIKIDIDSVTPYGDYSTFYGLINNTYIQSHLKDIEVTLNNVLTNGAFYGLGSSLYGLNGPLTLKLGNIMVNKSYAYGLASTLYEFTGKLSVDIDTMRILAPNSTYGSTLYGLSSTLGSSSYPADLNQADIHIGALINESKGGTINATAPTMYIQNPSTLPIRIDEITGNGAVYLMASTPYSVSGNIEIGKVKTDGNIFGVFSSGAYYTGVIGASNVRLTVDDALSTNGNIYLLGQSISNSSNTYQHKYNNIAVRFNRAEALKVMPISSITSTVSTNLSISINDLAIYADAYTHDKTLSPLIVDTINITNGSPSFSNIVINTRLNDCNTSDDTNDCTMYPEVNAISTATNATTLSLSNIYWYQRDPNQTLNDSGVKAIAFGKGAADLTPEKVIQVLGDKWELLKLSEGEDAIEIPWLK